jgi:hypothetical protein
MSTTSAGARALFLSIGRFATLLMAIAMAYGCGDGGCQLHSDCSANEQCVSGVCEPTCSDDFDCPLGEACRSSVCVAAPDAVRPRPCNPETNEAGCPDATSPGDAVLPDAEPVDAVASDGPAPPDALADAAGDAGFDATADAVGLTDAAGPGGDLAPLPDGGLTPIDIDLTGTYAVTRGVDLTNDPAFSEGDVANFIANLTRLPDGARYRLDYIDPEGFALSSEVALDFRSPEGPLNYQFRYERPVLDAVAPCTAVVETFERGEVRVDRPQIELAGQQILHQAYDGEGCAEADRLTNFTVRWVRIPTPEPGADGGAPQTDGGASDAAAPAADGPALQADAAQGPDAGAVPVVDAATPGADAR